MKTKLITLLIVIFAVVGDLYAQKNVNIYTYGKVLYSLSIADIDSIKFEEKKNINIYKEGEVLYNPSIADIDSIKFEEKNFHNGYEYVDLGLPSGIKWATYNVGASAPEEFGDYFAWGETLPKNSYDWGTYKYCEGTLSTLTKYCTDSSYGTVDDKTVLEMNDDVANVNWGGNWRIPTRAEQEELKNNCKWEWSTLNGVKGYKATSNINGNFIFLPASGYKYEDKSNYVGSYGYYMTSSLNTIGSYSTIFLYFASFAVDWEVLSRCCGLPVRPVYDTSIIKKYKVSVSTTEGGTAEVSKFEINEGEEVTLIATASKGYQFKNWTLNGDVVSTENPYTVSINANSDFVANFEAFTPEYIDLGLPSGIKWATYNVGAFAPEEYGDYFAWGETSPKSSYVWGTYKYCNGSSSTITKYCTDSSYGVVDNKTTLELEDDAAHINWGGNWRMPTEEEQQELKDTSNCTWKWSTLNGVKGYKITSNTNGNSIFLPAAGCKSYGTINDEGVSGYYCSSTLSTNGSDYVDSFFINLFNIEIVNMGRQIGFSIRAVCE